MRNKILENYIRDLARREWKELAQKSWTLDFTRKEWGEEIETIKKWMNYPSEHALIADCVADHKLKKLPEEKINVEEWRKLIF